MMKRWNWLWVLVVLVVVGGAWTYFGPNEEAVTASASASEEEEYSSYSPEFAEVLELFREEFGPMPDFSREEDVRGFDTLLSSVQTVEDAQATHRMVDGHYRAGVYEGLTRQIWTEKCKEELSREPKDVSHLVGVAKNRCPDSDQIVPELAVLADTCRDWSIIESYESCKHNFHPDEQCQEILSRWADACREDLNRAETIEEFTDLVRAAPEEVRVRAAEQLIVVIEEEVLRQEDFETARSIISNTPHGVEVSETTIRHLVSLATTANQLEGCWYSVPGTLQPIVTEGWIALSREEIERADTREEVRQALDSAPSELKDEGLAKLASFY